MATTIRPELSKGNKYWIDKHRYYELKHFCLQYPLWKSVYLEMDGFGKRSVDTVSPSNAGRMADPVAGCIEARSYYFERMHMVEQATIAAAEDLSSYLLRAVTEGISYDSLKARLEMPCCKDVYYAVYRRFFYLLSEVRK